MKLKRWMVLAASLLLLTASLVGCGEEAPVYPQAAEDENLRLEIIPTKTVYESGEPVECTAVVSFVGELPEGKYFYRFTTGDPVVSFASLDGLSFERHSLDVTNSVAPGHTLSFPYSKVLESGRHTIYANLAYDPLYEEDHHSLTVSVQVEVD